MKKILLWDPRFPRRDPIRLTVADDLASAIVRSGIGTAADPAEAGALSAGGALDPSMLTEVMLQHGPGNALQRVFLPYSVVLVGAAAGVLASIGTPVAGSTAAPPSTAPTKLSAGFNFVAIAAGMPVAVNPFAVMRAA